jgi:hypothetical protein
VALIGGKPPPITTVLPYELVVRQSVARR